MVKIVADKDIPYLEGVLEPYAGVVYVPGAGIGPEEAAEADALVVRTRTRCDAALLEGSRVGMIATATIGYDHIDMEYCRAHGIGVATAAGCNARGVLQWFGAAMRTLRLSGRIGQPGEVAVGVVGVGNVGSLVARYASLWGFRTLCCDPFRAAVAADDGMYRPAEFFSLEQVARQADVVTFHVPLSCAGPHPTAGMAGTEFFGMLRPGAVVLNSSRGEIADSAALLGAVASGRCGCVIDTWAGEPRIDPALLRVSLLATPHIAGYTLQGKAMGTAMSVRALARHFGWPLTDWYPPQAGDPSRAVDISWDEMCRRMPQHFDIEAQSAALKANPAAFESMRNQYAYRREFF